MKKAILIVVLLFCFKVQAQISIYREDFGLADEWFLMATDTNVDPEELAPLLPIGANSNWDATGIRSQFLDTMKFLSPAQFPSAPEGCNLIFMNPVLSVMPDFYQVNIAQLKQVIQPDGFFGAEGKLNYLNFPSTYSNKFEDSIETIFRTLAVDLGIPANPLFDSAMVIFRQINRSDFVGYGTIRVKFNNLPIPALKRKLISSRRTYFKVRNKLTGAYVDIPGGFDPGGINTDLTTFQWFASNGGVPILELEMKNATQAKSANSLINSSRLLSTGQNEISVKNELLIYPNPGTDYFEIKFPASLQIDAVSIYDVSGKLLREFNQIESNQIIQHRLIEPGWYVIQVKSGDQIHNFKWMKIN
ncbi:MAG: T9SS type A sorting domain-containing protein [Bacteroidia bacterium]